MPWRYRCPWLGRCRVGLSWRPGTGRAGPVFGGGGRGGCRALPGPGVVSGGGVWEPGSWRFPAGLGGGQTSKERSGREAEAGSSGSAQRKQRRGAASMFARNHRSRVTVARGSALEMEFKRGRFRLSVFSDSPEVSARVPALPSLAPQAAWQPLPPARVRARRRAQPPRSGSKPAELLT